MIGNKIADAVAKSFDNKISKVPSNSPKNTSETKDVGFNNSGMSKTLKSGISKNNKFVEQ